MDCHTLPPHPGRPARADPTPAEIDALAKDIRRHGQRHPIVLVEGMIWDGLRRWIACRRLGLIPRTLALEEPPE